MMAFHSFKDKSKNFVEFTIEKNKIFHEFMSQQYSIRTFSFITLKQIYSSSGKKVIRVSSFELAKENELDLELLSLDRFLLLDDNITLFQVYLKSISSSTQFAQRKAKLH